MLAFTIIVAVAIVGGAFKVLWAIPLGAMALAAIATWHNRQHYARVYAIGTNEAKAFWLGCFGTSLFNGLVACGAAYILGAIAFLAAA